MELPVLHLEGTLEEIRKHLPDPVQNHLHVDVYLTEPTESEDKPFPAQSSYQQTLAAALQEIETRSFAINPKPDKHDYLREGRAGEMFGHDPAE